VADEVFLGDSNDGTATANQSCFCGITSNRKQETPWRRWENSVVDVGHSTEIEDDFFALRHQVFHKMAEVGRRIATQDIAAALDDCAIR
jgi:hypothetical protein